MSNSATTGSSLYDRFPYKSLPFRESRPDGLATIATAMGLDPPRADRCRVLELGCSSGGNLIPLAEQFPNSQFLGVDFSATELSTGQAAIAELKLPNIRLEQRDISNSNLELGTFDYIIAHGLFSWVPPAVQQRILAICAENLAERGVAYVSYNTYPGWGLRGVMRDLMRYNTRHLTDLGERARAARKTVDQLIQSLAAFPDTVYANAVREEQKTIHGLEDYALIHDHLEDDNHPLYFHEFVQRAADRGLQFLAEANFPSTFIENLTPDAARTVAAMASDRIEAAQYRDFITNRFFRQTLLCHANVKLDLMPSLERARRFFVASPARCEGQVDIASPAPARFLGRGNSSITTTEPPLKAIMLHLVEIWPRSVPMTELIATARGKVSIADERAVIEALWRCHSSGVVEFSLQPDGFTTDVSQQPVACGYARWQARDGNLVTNRRHEPVRMDELTRQVVRRLDGSCDRATLMDALAQILDRGGLVASEHGQPIRDPTRAKQLLGERLDGVLRELGRAALLVQ